MAEVEECFFLYCFARDSGSEIQVTLFGVILEIKLTIIIDVIVALVTRAAKNI